jgi:uncharacterized repeat protein (TIGR02543 family)
MPASAVTINVTLRVAETDSTVIFISNGETYTTVEAVSGSTIEAPTEPVKEGNYFGGWYTDEAFTNVVSFPYTVNGNTTLYARWTDQYTVTFISDGSIYTAIEAYTDSVIGVPEAPIRAGHHFGGWYMDEEFTNAVIFLT